jgi:hypothetical protein
VVVVLVMVVVGGVVAAVVPVVATVGGHCPESACRCFRDLCLVVCRFLASLRREQGFWAVEVLGVYVDGLRLDVCGGEGVEACLVKLPGGGLKVAPMA